jgi:hypothetical protein
VAVEEKGGDADVDNEQIWKDYERLKAFVYLVKKHQAYKKTTGLTMEAKFEIVIEPQNAASRK